MESTSSTKSWNLPEAFFKKSLYLKNLFMLCPVVGVLGGGVLGYTLWDGENDSTTWSYSSITVIKLVYFIDVIIFLLYFFLDDMFEITYYKHSPLMCHLCQ